MSLSDITIFNVDTPYFGVLGEEIIVSSIVGNQGIETTDSLFWNENIYLSDDEILDEEDYQFFSGWVRNSLASGEQYEIIRNFILPNNGERGNRYLIFTVDEDNRESEINEDNNIFVVPFEINTPNVDLVVTSVEIPATTVLDEREIEVTWMVTNRGTDTVTNNDWYDYIYVSEDEILDEDDVYLEAYSSEDNLNLAPGDSYTSTENLSLPNDAGIGSRYLLFVADRENEQQEINENNNVYAASIELNPPETDDIDLVVTDVNIPATALLSERIDVSWTVTNQGTDTVITDEWYDEIYWSEDEILDKDDIYLQDGYTEENLNLVSGASYTSTENFDLPSDAKVGSSYLLFVIDEENQHWETNENNNIYAAPIELKAPDVDLIVTDANVPTTIALNGESIEVSFTVTNQGTEATTSDYLYDEIYLSQDEIFDEEEDIYLDDVSTDEENLPIAPGDSYVATEGITLRNNPDTGNYYILFVADEDNNQSETDETNNVYAAPIELTTPDVDLAVTTATAPATATLSDEIEVSWTTLNQGTDTAVGGSNYWSDSWYDSVYLSEDENFDENDTQVHTEIFSRWTGGSYSQYFLNGGDSDTNTRNIRIPSNAALGEQYLLFVTDSDENKQLETDDSNNVYSLPIELTSSNVDLAVADVTYPEVAHRGETVELSWTVANQGTDATSSYANYELTDSFYLSEDEILDSGDRQLRSFYVGDNTPIEAEEDYSLTGNVSIPTDIEPGEYYLFLATDSSQQQSETDRTNNIWRSPIEIGTDGANLVISQVNAPTNATLSETVEVSWTVENQGGIATPAIENNYYYYDTPTSYDYLYISDDEILDDDDTFVTRYDSRNDHPLTGGDSYSVTQNITIPNTTPGDRYLLLAANDNEHIWETDQDDNVLATPISLRQPDVNLVVTDATAPTEAIWGNTIELSWTVENQGTEATLVDEWYDYVYLSEDETIDDRDRLIVLDSIYEYSFEDTPLEPGESYTNTQSVTLPQIREGEQYFLFTTDYYREQSETNLEDNVRAVPLTVRNPDVDLVITDTNAPINAKQGDTIELSWTIANQGSDATNASYWYDYVYISDRETLDGEYDYLTSIDRDGDSPIQAGDSYSQTVDIRLSEYLTTGDRYLVFVADDYRQQFETDNSNNTIAVPFSLNELDVDFVPTNLEAPTSAKLEESIEISWTIANQGSDATNASDWHDYIYFSTDEIYDFNDEYLGDFERDGGFPITAGSDYTRNETIFLPDDVDAGEGYLIVVSNRDGQQLETDDTNNTLAIPFELTTPDVDLIVTEAIAPGEASKGDYIDLTWTVANQGSDTIYASWYDYVYLSDDEILDDDDEDLTYYYIINPPGGISSGYTQTTSVFLDNDLKAGDRYLLFVTDEPQNQIEIDDANNTLAIPFTLNESNIDLTISDIEVSTTALRGETIDISWLDNSAGTVDINNSWSNRIYLSTDDVAGDDDDIYLAEFYYAETISAGTSATRNESITIPANLAEGNYNLYIEGDDYNNITEIDEENNITFLPQTIEISSPDVDLSLSDITVPAAGVRGQSIELSWTVNSQGAEAATGYWSDRIYLSTNDIAGDDDDIEIETIYYDEAIAAGNSRIRTAQVYLPAYVGDGDHQVVVETDIDNSLAEKDETNNKAISTEVISLSSPDLVVSNITAPLEGLSGEEVDITWTITNQGDVAATGSWYDTVYFSEDSDNATTTDTVGDLWLGNFLFEGTIEPGESITRTQTVALPIYLQGEGVLKVDSDSYDYLVENDEDNNISISEQPFTSVLAPYPNLVVGEVTVPDQIFSGQRVPIEWTVNNTGTGATNASYWQDDVWLSLDDVIDSSDIYLTVSRNASYLESGQGYTSNMTVEIPKEAEGNYQFLVRTDSDDRVFENEDENDNFEFSNPVKIEPYPAPDLQVTTVNGANRAFSGQQSTVSYTVTNEGEGLATGNLNPIYKSGSPRHEFYEIYREDLGWTDYIYISEDEILDDDDYVVGSHRRDTKYEVFVTETITRYYPESEYYDDYSTVPTFESTTETNTYESIEDHYYAAHWYIDRIAGNDNELEDLTDSWTKYVENYNFVDYRPINPPLTWDGYDDYRYYYPDDRYEYEIEIRPIPASLEPGASYSVTQDVTLPIGISGDYHVLVKSDRNDEADELTFETNNTNFDPDPTQIYLTPPPDLEIELIDAPTEASASHEFTFNYSIFNFGSTVTPNSSWQDKFYLSEDDQLDPETDLYLGSNYAYGNLQPGDGYESEVSFILPDEIEGDYYLFIATDSEDDVFELDNANNIRFDNETIAIASRPADLVVTNFNAPDTASAGQGIFVEWTVANQGTGDTAVEDWRDHLVISSDDELGNNDDLVLQTFYRNGLLDVGEDYTQNANVSVPSELVGDYNLFLVSDVGDHVYEAGAEDNSAILPVSITRETADLQVTEVTAAETGESGKNINVSWTVQNLGTATTNNNYWYDEVFLSPDLTLGNGNDISLGSVWRGDALEPNEEYEVTRSFEIPENLEGDYHVIVKTDSSDYSDRGEVIEDGKEDNNEAAVTDATVISLSPVPDLVLESVEVPGEGVSGQSFELSWTVRNDGTADINNEWRTSFYLSRDQVFDRNSDTYIGFAEQQGNLIEGETLEENTYSLAAGEAITETQSFEIPSGVSGTLYAFAVVDSGNSIYERDGEANNIAFDGNSMQVVLPPSVSVGADLVVNTITIPENGAPGQEVTIEYLVENQGNNTANSNWIINGRYNSHQFPWQDSIYISADPEWDANDPLFSRVSAKTSIASGDSYTNSVTAALPGIAPGEYYVIVRSDIYNNVSESNEANNTDVSEATFVTDVEVLELATPTTGRLDFRKSNYYRIDVEAGETLKVNFDSEASIAANELYLSYGEVPSRISHDYSFSDPFSADHEIVVSNTKGGSYYLLAYGDTSADYTIEAEVLDFSLLDIGTDTGSNAGEVTTTILGAEFTPDTEVSLVMADGSELPADKVTRKDNAELWATFDLEDLESGQYDVKVQDGAETAVLEDRFTVTDGAPGEVEVTMSIPPALRPGQQGIVTIRYTNIGETDVIAPLITLNASNANLRLPGQAATEDSELQFLGINNEGPAGILPPGASESINVIFEPTVEAVSVGFSLSQISEPDELYDLSDSEDLLRPEGIPDEDWDNIWQNFTSGVGETAGDYNAALAENATHLSQLGDRTNDVGELVNFEFLQASGYGSLLERNTTGSFGRGRASLLAISAITDVDGNVTIQDGNTTIEFERQADGTYLSPAGDSISLVSEDGVYKLSVQNSSTLVFRTDGKLDYTEDINGNRLQTAYTDGQLTELISSNGDRVDIEYNEFGRIAKTTDDAGRVSTYSYDETGEYLLSVTTPEGTTAYTYNTASDAAESAVTSITYPDGTQQLFEYDDRGRLSSQSLGDGSETLTYEYDSTGGVTVTDASGASIDLLLTNDGQIGQITDDLGRITKYQYDLDGNLTEIVQPDGTTTTLEYDNGNIVREIDGLGKVTEFSYDPVFNQLASVIDPRGNGINYNYNDTGDLDAITYADGSGEQYNYDPQGRLVESVNRRGQAIEYEYSDRDLLTKKTLADGSEVSYTYDEAGNLASTTDATGTTSLEYDDADRLTKITYPNGRFVAYSYDEAGRRTQMTDQNGFTTNYSYNEQGRLSGLTDGDDNSLVAYQYNELGLLSHEDNGNGTYTTYEYDSVGQTTSVVNYASDDTVNSRFDYTYNDRGLRSSMTTLEGTWNYGYDATGQLTSVTLPDGNTIDYEYDAAGNRIAVTDGEISSEYLTNNLNQYTSAGNAVFTYDTDGNIATKTENGQTWTYTYDSENRLVGVDSPDDSWTYEYDVFGNRTASIHNGDRTEYLIDPLGNTGLADVIGEYNADGELVANYVHGIGLETRVGNGSASYFDFDALGSTAGLTGASGEYINQYSYTPFGKDLTKTEAIANPFEYVGQWGVMDEANGLDFMRARYYDSQTGRFINPDPIGIAGSLRNYYSYVVNNPIIFNDPSGLIPTSIDPNKSLPSRLRYRSELGECGKEFEKQKGPIDLRHYEAARLTAEKIRTLNGLLDQDNDWLATPAYVITNILGLGVEILQFIGGQDSAFDPNDIHSNNVGALAGSEGTNFYPNQDSCTPKLPRPPKPPKPPTDEDPQEDNTDIIRPIDPNDILGPEGFGEERWISAFDPIPYTIRFENQETATAPAQEVRISNPLDEDLDFRSFRLGNFGWSEYYFEVPENSAFYQERLDLTEEQGFLIDVVAGIDVAAGEAFWTITTIDPETGEVPEDALAGFLLPNNEDGVGDGFVTYTIEPRSDVETGDVVDAKATIIFDTEEPIDTPPIFNTLDADTPTSTAKALPETSETENSIVSSDIDTPAMFNALSASIPISAAEALPETSETENFIARSSINTSPSFNAQSASILISTAEALPKTSETENFIVKWSGNDIANGSALAGYDVYVADNAGEYTLWLDNTTLTEATYTGEPGHTYSFYTIATDNVGNRTATPTEPQVVIRVAGGEPPVVTTNQALTVEEGATDLIGTSILEITDPDSTAAEISYTLTNLPNNGTLILEDENLTLNDGFTQADIDSNLLSYQHDGGETTEDSFSFIARDFSGNSLDSTTFNIAITPVNNAPTLENPLTDLVIQEDSEFNLTIPTDTFADVDPGDTLTYTATLEDGSKLPSWLTLNAVTGAFNGTPTNDDVGSLDLQVTATDSGNETIADNFTLTIENVDDAPVVQNAIADLTVDEDAENTVIDLTNIFTDIDNDDSAIAKVILTNTNEELVTATIVDNQLVLDYQDNQNGSADITIRGTSNGLTVEETFSVTVNPIPDGLISVTESSGDPDDASILFGTPLSQFREGITNSDLVRPSYPDKQQYVDITNTGDGILNISEIRLNPEEVTAELPEGDIVLNPSETQRIQVAYSPSAAGEDFNLDDGLTIFSNADNNPEFTMSLAGKSTFDSDINYDGAVGFGDLGPLNASWGQENTGDNWDATADINGDGLIGFADLGPLNQQWNQDLASI